MSAKYTAKQFIVDLRSGPYTWPGGYPRTFWFADGEPCCYRCARKHALRLARDTRDAGDWALMACDVKWENDEGEYEHCEQCGEHIEVAYP